MAPNSRSTASRGVGKVSLFLKVVDVKDRIELGLFSKEDLTQLNRLVRNWVTIKKAFGCILTNNYNGLRNPKWWDMRQTWKPLMANSCILKEPNGKKIEDSIIEELIKGVMEFKISNMV